MKKVKWACPKCGAEPNGKHGKGGVAKCEHGREPDCYGFVCECADDSEEHGDSADNPCHVANCYHCGWGGTFPVPLFDPKKLKGWAKQAYAAGWKPPVGWTP
jgi:hypothetical protein